MQQIENKTHIIPMKGKNNVDRRNQLKNQSTKVKRCNRHTRSMPKQEESNEGVPNHWLYLI